MLKRRKRDWFPIVATDLFCGTLAAVILLDAVSPKEAGSVGDIAFIEIVSEFNPGDDCTDVGRIVFTFLDSGERLNSKDHGSSSGARIDKTCVIQSFFPQVINDGAPDEATVVVAESASTKMKTPILIRSSRFPEMTCNGDGMCALP